MHQSNQWLTERESIDKYMPLSGVLVLGQNVVFTKFHSIVETAVHSVSENIIALFIPL
jgi:hypothetical protein